MNKIQVFGPGCAKCEDMTNLVKDSLKELNYNLPVDKVTDAMQFAMAGVIVTPALVVDGKVVVSGRVPGKEELKGILKDTLDPKNPETSKQNSDSCCCSCAPSSCCGGSENNSGGGSFRKVVVWLILGLILLAAVKMINRKSKEGSDTPKEIPVGQITTPKENRIDLVYYQYGARCTACIKMEQWAEEAIQDQFADQINSGDIVWQSTQADKDTVSRYSLVTKSLILKSIRNGQETSWSNLDKIWNLNRDEQAFKTYIVDTVTLQLPTL